jgi:hypothetical protein
VAVTSNVGITIAKLIATIGILVAVLAILFGSFSFLDSIAPPPGRTPFWEISAACALLIPTGMALWWPRPVPVAKRLDASFLGIAAASVPLAAQFASWSFFFRGDATLATEVETVFATVLLSTIVTRHFLITGSPDKLANVLPPHIHGGLVRLYAILFIPWILYFGYAIYEENAHLDFNGDQPKRVDLWVLQVDSDPIRADYAIYWARGMIIDWKVTGYDDISELINEERERTSDRLTVAIYALLAGIAPAMLYPLFLWVVAGFRKTT